MPTDNPSRTRNDIQDAAELFNAALLNADEFNDAEAAISALAVTLTPIITRGGRMSPDRFLALCGIEKHRKTPRAVPLKGRKLLNGEDSALA